MRMFSRFAGMVVAGLGCVLSLERTVADETVFPGTSWSRCEPAERNMDAAALDKLAQALGGRGCVIKDGVVVKEWGDQAEIGDWFSSAKPVLSTLLFFAIQEGKLDSVHKAWTSPSLTSAGTSTPGTRALRSGTWGP